MAAVGRNGSTLITAIAERCVSKIVESVADGKHAWEDDSYDATND